jgi:hypothetical protein
MADDGEGNPIPYRIPTGGEAALVRIPHDLSTPGNPRIPDVVIPVMVVDLTQPFSVGIPGVPWMPGVVPVAAGGPKTGMWADDTHVYVFALGLGFPEASFVVYIEYTHSVIRNEIVTGDYDVIEVGP